MVSYGDKVVFLHFPRTGGTYLSKRLEEEGIAKMANGDAHRIPFDSKGLALLVVLREPISWLKSYSDFRKRGGRACVEEIDRYIDTEPALSYLVINLPKRILDHVYRNYANVYPKTYCINYEHLPESLNQFCDEMELPHVALDWKPVRAEINPSLREILRNRNPIAYQLYKESLP